MALKAGEVDQREHRLASVDAGLRARNESLEVSNAALGAFARVAAHDLSEPLRIVVTFLQLLERDYGHTFDEQASEYLAFAMDGAVRMRALIDALLTFAQVDGERLVALPVDTSALVASVLRDLSGVVADAKGHVDVAAMPAVVADEGMLRLVFQNLIANALKFHAPEHAPHVRVVGIAEDEVCRFWVDDDGIGIPPEDRGVVFGMFRRLHPRSKYPGSGLGLSLCDRVVSAHGGHIRVLESPLGGSRFEFTIARPPNDERAG